MQHWKTVLALVPCIVWAGSSGAFEASWTDQFGETSYTIAGPDTVLVGTDFQVTLSAEDALYPEAMVAAPWNFQVDAAVHDNGFGLFLTGGLWSEVYTFNFAEAGSHDFLFSAQDMGHGGGAHNWEWMEIGGGTLIVVDDVAVAASSWSRVKAIY